MARIAEAAAAGSPACSRPPASARSARPSLSMASLTGTLTIVPVAVLEPQPVEQLAEPLDIALADPRPRVDARHRRGLGACRAARCIGRARRRRMGGARDAGGQRVEVESVFRRRLRWVRGRPAGVCRRRRRGLARVGVGFTAGRGGGGGGEARAPCNLGTGWSTWAVWVCGACSAWRESVVGAWETMLIGTALPGSWGKAPGGRGWKATNIAGMYGQKPDQRREHRRPSGRRATTSWRGGERRV